MKLTGTGEGATGPRIEDAPALLDFETVDIGRTRDLTLTLRNAGTAALSVTSLRSSNSVF